MDSVSRFKLMIFILMNVVRQLGILFQGGFFLVCIYLEISSDYIKRNEKEFTQYLHKLLREH